MNKTDTVNQFAVAQTPFHTHNDVDSNAIPFLSLKDTPSSYYGKAGNLAQVTSAENGLEFSDSPSLNNLTVKGNLLVQGSAQLVQSTIAQTVNMVSLQVGPSQVYMGVYCGAVTSGGTAGTPFPTDWTVSNTGTGNYLITHNLNNSNYIILLTGSTAREAQYTGGSINDVTILTRNSAGTLTDGSFSFILLVLQ